MVRTADDPALAPLTAMEPMAARTAEDSALALLSTSHTLCITFLSHHIKHTEQRTRIRVKRVQKTRLSDGTHYNSLSSHRLNTVELTLARHHVPLFATIVLQTHPRATHTRISLFL